MTDEIILKVENISKQYRLGTVGSGTLSHDLNRWWSRVRGKEDPFLKVGESNDRSTKGNSDYVWALKDINFEVKKGEVLGIIGKNGAGKSTLLKILSKVTSPTTGSIKFNGRIASLLEVGTGFHPELTGKENIYLNGAILGMTKAEIKSKLEEIVDFSGCERYIDTPVKRYSSGMKVRLAFAVAAHLEPEILIVDEVLAVGDAEFQKKAIGKMQDISNTDGRTVLFVSHNMAAVKSLCTRAVVLDNGSIVFKGKTDNSIKHYLTLGNNNGTDSLRFFDSSLFINTSFQISHLGIRNLGKKFNEAITREYFLELDIEIIKLNSEPIIIVFVFKDSTGQIIFATNSQMGELELNFIGKNNISMKIPAYFFNEGCFFIDLMITNGKKPLFVEKDAISFIMLQEKKKIGSWMGKSPGSLKPKFNWTTTKNSK